MCVGKLQLVLLPQAWAPSSEVGPILAQDAACDGDTCTILQPGISRSRAATLRGSAHLAYEHLNSRDNWAEPWRHLQLSTWSTPSILDIFTKPAVARWSPVRRWVITCPSQNTLLMSPGLPSYCRTPARWQLHSLVAIFIILFRYYWLLKWYIFNKIEVKWR